MSPGSGKNGKKDLNQELILTPFIDLLSVCVCFLLISAVWIEIGSVEIKQSHGTSVATEAKDSFDLEVFFNAEDEASLYVKKDGRTVQTLKVSGEGNFETFIKNIDNALVSKLLIGRTIGTATVATSPKLSYGGLVTALDVLRKNKIVNIGVMSGENP